MGSKRTTNNKTLQVKYEPSLGVHILPMDTSLAWSTVQSVQELGW